MRYTITMHSLGYMDKSSFITGQCIVADGGFMALGM